LLSLLDDLNPTYQLVPIIIDMGLMILPLPMRNVMWRQNNG
jgi:hypothetical protein